MYDMIGMYKTKTSRTRKAKAAAKYARIMKRMSIKGMNSMRRMGAMKSVGVPRRRRR